MDYLWTPWRYRYIADAQANKSGGCVFCEAQKMDDEKALIVLRGKSNFIILNAYPYTSGHVMVVPYAHLGDLATCPADTLAEMMQLTQRAQAALAAVYKPEGFNLGMNLGRCAGAGIENHIHMHVLPRWIGDTNFMTVVAETRMEPEDLATTYTKLHKALSAK
jgi:ATP adenylyltransferase